MTDRYSSPREYLDAARDPKASAEDLHTLAGCEYDFVHVAIANHPNAENRTLELLLARRPQTWNQQELAASIATHANAAPQLLRVLAGVVAPLLDNARGNDRALEAGLRVCSNPRTPPEAILGLLDEPAVSIGFRRKLAARTARRDVLARLVDDRSEAVRSRARRRMLELGLLTT